MRTTFGKTPSTFRWGVVGSGRLWVTAVLLVGVMVLGYGYFRQNAVGFYAGLIFILVGVLSGVIQILIHGNK